MGFVTFVTLNDTAQGDDVTLIAEAAESSSVCEPAAVPVVTVKVEILQPAVVDCPVTVGELIEKPPGAVQVVSPRIGSLSQKSTIIAWMLGLAVEIVLNDTVYVTFVALSVALLISILLDVINEAYAVPLNRSGAAATAAIRTATAP